MHLLARTPAFRRDFSYEEFSVWHGLVEDLIVARDVEEPAKKLSLIRVVDGIELEELLRNLPSPEITES